MGVEEGLTEMQIDVLCGLVDRTDMDIFPYEPSLKGLKNRTSGSSVLSQAGNKKLMIFSPSLHAAHGGQARAEANPNREAAQGELGRDGCVDDGLFPKVKNKKCPKVQM